MSASIFNAFGSIFPDLYRKEQPAVNDGKANFLCGNKCKNKRERERIENEARRQQAEQEAALRKVQLEKEEALLQQQQMLNDLEKQMQQLLVAREKENAGIYQPNASSPASSTNSSPAARQATGQGVGQAAVEGSGEGSSSNILLYAGIGLAVILVIFIIKRRS